MRNSLDNAAEVRLRIAEAYCPVMKRTGMHNNIQTRHWFRRYDVCASCGYVQRVKRLDPTPAPTCIPPAGPDNGRRRT